MRVVLDTNVLARPSFSTRGPAAELLHELKDSEHVLVVSGFILDELDRVLRYPRLQKLHGFDDDGIKNYVASVCRAATLVEVGTEPPAITPNDPDDDPIVATAVAGKTEFLGTRDHHLHSKPVVEYCAANGIRILTDLELLHVIRSLKRPAAGGDGGNAADV